MSQQSFRRIRFASMAVLALLSLLSASCARFGAPTARVPLDALVGWASVDGLGQNGTTGGAGGPVVTATTAKELKDYISRPGPLVILVSGTISLNQQSVASDKTIFGIGPNPTIIGGFRIQGQHNVIVRNLTITKSSYDGFSIEYGSHHVWVDHCDLSSCPDGLLDVTHGCDYVTVSWNRFHDHRKTCLLGQADDNGREDTGHLTVTYHHNWFDGSKQRHPRVRFSRLCHVFNNYYVGNSQGPGRGVLLQGRPRPHPRRRRQLARGRPGRARQRLQEFRQARDPRNRPRAEGVLRLHVGPGFANSEDRDGRRGGREDCFRGEIEDRFSARGGRNAINLRARV
jgi:pectate lyase